MSEHEQVARDPNLDGGLTAQASTVIAGWRSRGRCPVDANVVHVDPVYVTSSTPGVIASSFGFPAETEVDQQHGCGVRAVRVGPGEAPLLVDD